MRRSKSAAQARRGAQAMMAALYDTIGNEDNKAIAAAVSYVIATMSCGAKSPTTTIDRIARMAELMLVNDGIIEQTLEFQQREPPSLTSSWHDTLNVDQMDCIRTSHASNA